MNKTNISGQRIKQSRIGQGLDQVELSAALKVDFNIILTQSDISEIERGVRGIKDFELDAISRVLNVSPVWLLRGNEND